MPRTAGYNTAVYVCVHPPNKPLEKKKGTKRTLSQLLSSPKLDDNSALDENYLSSHKTPPIVLSAIVVLHLCYLFSLKPPLIVRSFLLPSGSSIPTEPAVVPKKVCSHNQTLTLFHVLFTCKTNRRILFFSFFSSMLSRLWPSTPSRLSKAVTYR